MWVVFCREAEDRFRLKNYKKTGVDAVSLIFFLYFYNQNTTLECFNP